MSLLDLAFRDLLRRPLRSLLTLMGICAAVGSFTVLVCMAGGLERAWVGSIDRRGVHIVGVAGETAEILTGSVDEEIVDDIAKMDGVAAASGELVNVLRIDHGKQRVYVVVKAWPADSFFWDTLRLSAGHLPARDDETRVVVGQTVAKALELDLGDTLTLRGRPFVVAGITAPSGAISDSGVLVPLEVLQKLMKRTRKLTQIGIQMKDPSDARRIAALKSELASAHPDVLFLETSEVADNNDVITTFRAITWATAVVAMVMAVVVVLNTLLMAVTERTREVGILTALGWNPGRVVAMILVEGMVLVALGSLAGFAVGIPALQWIVELPRLRGLIEPHVTQELVVNVLAAAFALGVLGSAYPAWRAARLNPVQALRYE